MTVLVGGGYGRGQHLLETRGLPRDRSLGFLFLASPALVSLRAPDPFLLSYKPPESLLRPHGRPPVESRYCSVKDLQAIP